METNLNNNADRLYRPSCTEAEAGSDSPMLVMHGNARPNDLNKQKNRLVKAAAQSAMMDTLEPLLTEAEEAVYRRGRNAKSYTMAKNATMGDYRRATGFEALIGYLYLSGQEDRMYELLDAGIAGVTAADDLHRRR